MPLFKQPLTQMFPSYTGQLKYIEIMPSDDTIYLQRVDGCGYDVNELTPLEAIAIGEELVKAGRKLLGLV